MGTLKVIDIGNASITVEQWPEGHRWDFPVIVLDDNRRCLAHGDFQAARETAVGSNVAAAAYSLAESEAYKLRMIG